jgi:hypothetical protein
MAAKLSVIQRPSADEYFAQNFAFEMEGDVRSISDLALGIELLASHHSDDDLELTAIKRLAVILGETAVRLERDRLRAAGQGAVQS